MRYGNSIAHFSKQHIHIDKYLSVCYRIDNDLCEVNADDWGSGLYLQSSER